jgi:hypothetical protein
MQMEFRHHTRYEIQVPVEIEWQSETGKQKARGFTRNISSKGAFLFCEPEIPMGSYVHLTILLRTDGVGPQVAIDVVGKVCRVVKPIGEGEISGLAVENFRIQMNDKVNEENSVLD